MMQVIDQAYLAAIFDLPDGLERLERWVHQLIDDRETAERIAKACARDIEPLRRRRDELLAVINHEISRRREDCFERDAQIDAFAAEVDHLRPRYDLAVEALRRIDQTGLDFAAVTIATQALERLGLPTGAAAGPLQ